MHRRPGYVSVIFTLILLFACLAGAQSAAPGGDQAIVYKLQGTVVNSITGLPVPRALVFVGGAKHSAMLTGPEGQFEFSGLPAGNAYVTIIKPGFSPEGMEGERMPSVIIEVGAKTGKVELKLVPECVITGQITGKDEEPLEGASIDALAVRIQGGHKQLVPVRRGVTSDEDGNFRLAGLAPGRYYIRARTANVSRRILGALSESGSQAYPPVVYYPASNELESATPLDLTGRHRAHVILSLNLPPPFHITGALAA